MRIDEALKLSDIAITLNGGCVCRIKDTDWYYHNTEGTASLHELKDLLPSTTWQPAYVRPQFKVGEKVSFLQACLSGQCFVVSTSTNVRRCVDIVSGKTKVYTAYGNWGDTTKDFCPSDTATIVADPSQEQLEPEKRKRTSKEILADIQTLMSELEDAK